MHKKLSCVLSTAVKKAQIFQPFSKCQAPGLLRLELFSKKPRPRAGPGLGLNLSLALYSIVKSMKLPNFATDGTQSHISNHSIPKLCSITIRHCGWTHIVLLFYLMLQIDIVSNWCHSPNFFGRKGRSDGSNCQSIWSFLPNSGISIHFSSFMVLQQNKISLQQYENILAIKRHINIQTSSNGLRNISRHKEDIIIHISSCSVCIYSGLQKRINCTYLQYSPHFR